MPPRQRLWHINRGGSPYFEYSYDLNGNLKKRQHMSQGQGQNSTTFAYDDVNRVTLCDQKRDNQSYFARSNYNDYDLVNNLKSISREEDGNKGELFLYDHANQLSSVSYKADVTPHAPGAEAIRESANMWRRTKSAKRSRPWKRTRTGNRWRGGPGSADLRYEIRSLGV